MESPQRTAWNVLAAQQKESAIRALMPAGFTFQRLEIFEAYGKRLETAVLAFEGSEFVFVPGDEVTLGWDGEHRGADSTANATWESDLTGIGKSLEEAERRLRGVTTPVRNVVIRPMLVERNTHMVGWTEISPEELAGNIDGELLEQLAYFRENTDLPRQYSRTHRFDREADSVRVYSFNESEDFEEWADSYLEQPFDIPTEDEWEYLRGAGCRTLFPWGDEISDLMRQRHGDDLRAQEAALARGENLRSRSSSVNVNLSCAKGEPSIFGLCFLRDPYQKELTRLDEEGHTGKGGDGGGAHSANLNAFYSYLPTSVYYRDHHEDELEWIEWLDQMHYRRIVRL